jgi:hypothetical protein
MSALIVALRVGTWITSSPREECFQHTENVAIVLRESRDPHAARRSHTNFPIGTSLFTISTNAYSIPLSSHTVKRMKGYYALRGRCFTRTHYKTRTEVRRSRRNSAPATRRTQRFKREAEGAPPLPSSIRVPRRDNLCRGCGRTIEDGRENCATCAVPIDPIWPVTTVTRNC